MLVLYPRKPDWDEEEYEWKKARSIDDGAHGMVYKCRKNSLKKLVAVKKFKIPLNIDKEIYT